MTLDPARFPRTVEYLAALPAGLESFPACQARSSVFEPHVRDFSALALEADLPEGVADLLSGRLSDRPWVPEVLFQAAYLIVRDIGFTDEQPFEQWLFDVNHELFDRPLLRNLMRLVSPSLIVLGAAKRWSPFHSGSELVPGAVENGAGRTESVSRLKYPEGLFSRTFLVGLEQSFLAALIMAKAKEPSVSLIQMDPGVATYRASWRK